MSNIVVFFLTFLLISMDLLTSGDVYQALLAYKTVLHMKHCFNGGNNHRRLVQLEPCTSIRTKIRASLPGSVFCPKKPGLAVVT